MPEPIEPHADPIPQSGAPEWAPSAADDSNAATDPPRQQNVRAIFFGEDGLRAGWSLLLFVAITAALAFAANRIVHALHPGAPHQAHPKLTTVSSVLAGDYGGFALAALAAFIVSRVERRRFGRYGIGLPTAHRIKQFLLGSALGLGALSLLVLVLWKTGHLAFDGVQMHGPAVLQYGLLWFVAFVGVGLMEEFLTRGFVQFTVTRGLAGLARSAGLPYRRSVAVGFWVAAAIFAAVFGLGHTSNSGESPFGIASTVIIAFVFVYSLWRTGSLWWAIGYHAAWDWAQSFLFGTPDSGLMMQNHFLSCHSIGTVLLSGGLTGPEGSIFDLGEIVLTVLVIYFALPAEPGSYADPNWTPNDTVAR
ncbi:CPBP family intramembrane glutamic endopeptidase [Terriglobus aquaticus]|uniref:Lysostaphin resistance A-like protein n=1 Tax=Terriglobus aquaticus TaxID=940139 RepID=A0ABW9KN39_9BACT|nr:CPBP family intramembrane glutamic endopeptidase [Terriglobus aquaticus]